MDVFKGPCHTPVIPALGRQKPRISNSRPGLSKTQLLKCTTTDEMQSVKEMAIGANLDKHVEFIRHLIYLTVFQPIGILFLKIINLRNNWLNPNK